MATTFSTSGNGTDDGSATPNRRLPKGEAEATLRA
jgi:hypothetical protein